VLVTVEVPGGGRSAIGAAVASDKSCHEFPQVSGVE